MESSAIGRLLVVVAHPDDETFGCGSILLHARRHGLDTAVLCATRGEAGEAVDGTPPDRLAAVRSAETRAAGRTLGVSEIDFLDLVDSGMSGPVGPQTLVGTDPDRLVRLVRDRIEEWCPSIVITLDGGDGHRDHAAIRDATLTAVESASWSVDRVYLHALPQSLMRRWIDHIAVHDPSWEHLKTNVPGTPDELITTVIDTAAELPQREVAIRQHASQRSPFDALPPELYRDFLDHDRLQRVRPAWTGGPVETTLFEQPL